MSIACKPPETGSFALTSRTVVIAQTQTVVDSLLTESHPTNYEIHCSWTTRRFFVFGFILSTGIARSPEVRFFLAAMRALCSRLRIASTFIF